MEARVSSENNNQSTAKMVTAIAANEGVHVGSGEEERFEGEETSVDSASMLSAFGMRTEGKL